MTQPLHDAEPDSKGDRDPDKGDQCGLDARPQEIAEIGFQPNFEEKNQDAQLCEGVQHFRFMDEAEDARPNDDPGQKLAQDGGLANTFHALPGHLRGEPNEDETEEELANLHCRTIVPDSPSARRIWP